MIWPLLIAPLALLWIAAANACFWLVVGPEGLTIGRMWRRDRIGWDEISGWQPWQRGLPRVLRQIAPFLSPMAAGAVLLARDSTGIDLMLRDGSRRRLPREGFEPELAQVARAIVEWGLPRAGGGPGQRPYRLTGKV